MALELEFEYLQKAGVTKVDRRLDYLNFRCPICGDSKKNPYKKRGYILKPKDDAIPTYFCHNEGCIDGSFYKFLSEYAPSLAPQYMRARNKGKISSFVKKAKKQQKHDASLQSNVNAEFNLAQHEHIDKNSFRLSSHFIAKLEATPVELTATIPPAGINYLKARGFNDITKLSGLMWDKTNGQLVFMFLNTSSSAYGYQKRSILKKQYKIVLKNENTSLSVYNMNKLSRATKKVYVVESIFNALSIEPALNKDEAVIASLGTHLSKDAMNEIKARSPHAKNIYCFDNDKAGHKALENMMTADKSGLFFIYPSFWLKGVDLNDCIKDKIASPVQIKNTIDDNSFSALTAKLKMANKKF